MNRKLPAAILSALLYAQLVFGVAAVAAVVWDRAADRQTVIAEAGAVDLAATNTLVAFR